MHPQPHMQPQRPFGGQPQMQMPGAAPAAAQGTPDTSASPRQPPKSAWTEHTAPDGRKYYYNAATKTSSWTKPPELLLVNLWFNSRS